jgi:hypothetical protein
MSFSAVWWPVLNMYEPQSFVVPASLLHSIDNGNLAPVMAFRFNELAPNLILAFSPSLEPQ